MMAIHNDWIETKNRIRLSVYAYAYEFMNDSLVDDGKFDKLSQQIKPTATTGNKRMDEFFSKEFIADSGMWIRKHPELRERCDNYGTIYGNFCSSIIILEWVLDRLYHRC